MDLVNLSNNQKMLIERFKNYCGVQEKELSDFFSILDDLSDVVVKVNPIKLTRLLAEYPKMYLRVVKLRHQATISAKLLQREFDKWYAAKYLETVQILESNHKKETTDDSKTKTTKSSTGRVLKDHITNYLNITFGLEMEERTNIIDEVSSQAEMLEDVLKVFSYIRAAFQALSDLKEVWKPFVLDLGTVHNLCEGQEGQNSQNSPK